MRCPNLMIAPSHCGKRMGTGWRFRRRSDRSASWHPASATGSGAAESFEVTVKIRYAHPGAKAMVYPQENGEARVRLHTPQRAVTPGQAAVCYRGDEVVGGGWIVRQAVAATV